MDVNVIKEKTACGSGNKGDSCGRQGMHKWVRTKGIPKGINAGFISEKSLWEIALRPVSSL